MFPIEGVAIGKFILGAFTLAGSFTLTDRLTLLFAGKRFRQRIAADMEVVTKNHLLDLPRLQARIAELAKMAEGENPTEFSAFKPIWAHDFNLLSHLIENSAALQPKEFVECIIFYDLLGRLEEIRKVHNEAACAIATGASREKEKLQFVVYCLREQELEYHNVIEAGRTALKSLMQNHWFIHVDSGVFSVNDPPESGGGKNWFFFRKIFPNQKRDPTSSLPPELKK